MSLRDWHVTSDGATEEKMVGGRVGILGKYTFEMIVGHHLVGAIGPTQKMTRM